MVAPHITFCFPASGQCSGGGVADDQAYLSSFVLLFLLPQRPHHRKVKTLACNPSPSRLQLGSRLALAVVFFHSVSS